jgi:O-antigen/teichoic acid export membrane protein
MPGSNASENRSGALISPGPPERSGGVGRHVVAPNVRPDSTFGPAMLLMAGRTLGFAAAFCIPVVLARIFDQTEFGTYKQLFLIAGTLYCIGQLGMAESLLYFLPLRPGQAARYVMNSLLALAAGGLACLVFLAATGGEMARWLSNPELARYTTLLGVYLLLMLTSAGLENALIARKRYGQAAVTYILLDLVRSTFLLIPALLVRDLEWLLLGAVGFAALRCLMALGYLRAEFKGQLVPDRGLLGRQLAYAIPFQLSGILEIAQLKLHQYVVSYAFDAAAFAIYAVGCLDIPLAEFAMIAVVNVLMVRMAEALRDGRERMAVALWHDAIRKLALLFFPLTFLMIVAGPALIVGLFTERYRDSVPVFVVLSLALPLPALAVDGVLRVYAQTRFLFALNAIRLLVTGLLIGPLIAVWGLVGAAAATVIAVAVARALGVMWMSRITGMNLPQVLPWPSLGSILAAAAVAALPAALAGRVGELSPLGSFVVTSAVYGAGYLVALWGFRVLRDDEQATLRGLASSVIRSAVAASRTKAQP